MVTPCSFFFAKKTDAEELKFVGEQGTGTDVLCRVGNLGRSQEDALGLSPDVLLNKIIVVGSFHHTRNIVGAWDIRPNLKDRQGIKINIILKSRRSVVVRGSSD